MPGAVNSANPPQEIRFCRAPDGVRIAYAVHGSGPPLLIATCWLSHLQYDWESPVWRHFLAALGKVATVVRYDERGHGLSDWDVEDYQLEPDRQPASQSGTDPSATLSPRELEVLTLAADGQDNEDIARMPQHLSVRTVERHLQNIYFKLDVRGNSARTAAVARLLTRA